MTVHTAERRQHLAQYCEEMFDSLSRSDQRRAGQAYVAGLLHGTGKKSIRRIARESGENLSDQSLQQFVNQSRWDPGPVRQRLAAQLCRQAVPTAWVVGEVVFDKYGSESACVERQYVQSYGRRSNCQLGLFVSLACAGTAVPVTWRLSVPRSWDDDHPRRKKARIPKEERHQPYWRYQIDALDDLSGDWGVPAAPVVLDACQSPSFVELVDTLDGRGLDFLVKFDRAVPVRHHSVVATRPNAGPDQRGPAPSVHGHLADLGAAFSALPRTVESWVEPSSGRLMRAHFTRALVRSVLPADRERRSSSMPQVLLLEWGLGKGSPRSYWLTNMVDRPVDHLVRLTRQLDRVDTDIEAMRDRFGLCDYEGRSFPGWHHHVTLASVAYGFDLTFPHAGSPAVDSSRAYESG